MADAKETTKEKRWDNLLSYLLTRNPQAFVDFLEPGCRFVQHYRNKLPNTQLQPDGIMSVKRPWDAIFIARVECEAEGNEEISFRGLCYNVLIRREFKRPTKTYGLDLTGGERADRPEFLHLTTPGPESGQEEDCIDYHYKRIVMCRKTPKEIFDLGHLELLVFVPFTNGGLEYSVLKNMLSRLKEEGDEELFLHGYATATHMLKKKKKFQILEQIEMEFSDMIDILRDTPVYDRIFAEGEAKGVALGKAEGKAEREVEIMTDLRQSAVQIVARQVPQPPSLAPMVQGVLAAITDLNELMQLIFQIFHAQSAEQVLQILLGIQPGKEPAVLSISTPSAPSRQSGEDKPSPAHMAKPVLQADPEATPANGEKAE